MGARLPPYMISLPAMVSSPIEDACTTLPLHGITRGEDGERSPCRFRCPTRAFCCCPIAARVCRRALSWMKISTMLPGVLGHCHPWGSGQNHTGSRVAVTMYSRGGEQLDPVGAFNRGQPGRRATYGEVDHMIGDVDVVGVFACRVADGDHVGTQHRGILLVVCVNLVDHRPSSGDRLDRCRSQRAPCRRRFETG